jgi:1,4-alpha-glucan branching enzyme
MDDAGAVQVVFQHAVDGRATHVAIVGDFNGWSADATPMVVEDGMARQVVALAAGTCYRFRYVLDGTRWENDWAADAYVPNEFGGDDSVIDLTDVPAATPPAKPARAPRKSRAKKKDEPTTGP